MIELAASARPGVSARSLALAFEIISEIGESAVIRPAPSGPSSFVCFPFTRRPPAFLLSPAREKRYGSRRDPYRKGGWRRS